MRPRDMAFWQFEQWAVVQKFPIRAETIETKIVARIANFIVILDVLVGFQIWLLRCRIESMEPFYTLSPFIVVTIPIAMAL